jgi:hypothetical protein
LEGRRRAAVTEDNMDPAYLAIGRCLLLDKPQLRVRSRLCREAMRAAGLEHLHKTLDNREWRMSFKPSLHSIPNTRMLPPAFLQTAEISRSISIMQIRFIHDPT